MPSFFKRIIVVFVIMPFLWATANSINVTQTISQMTGVNIPSGFEIPGLREALDIKKKVTDEVDAQKSKAAKKARKMAVQALKKEVRKKYGPQAARLIPNDLTLDEAKKFNFGEFEDVLRANGIDPKVPSLPDKPKKPKPKAPPVKPGGNPYAKALNTLDKIAVKGRAPMTGYDRDQFGSAWSDSAGNFKWTGNGCDTRNDVLARDLVNVKRDGSCKVVSGTLPYENYTGKKNVKFIASGPYENNLDIEHIVALGNAWVTGAQQISADKRAALSNDPINLFAADPSSNRQKGDADFATWLPSNKSFRCDYAVKQIKVKKKYNLWVTKAEKAAMKNVLTGCTK